MELFLSRLNVDSSPRPARLVEEQEDEPPPLVQSAAPRGRAPPRPWQSVQFATRLRARAARISWDDQPLSVPRFIVLDTDRWKAYWDTTMTLLILFSAIEVPIRLSFAVEASAYSFEWWLDVFASLLSGAGVLASPHFDPASFLGWLGAEAVPPTWYSAVPTMHLKVLRAAQETQCATGAPPAHSLTLIRNCSAALLPSTSSELEHLFELVVMPTYAMTESMPTVMSRSESRDEHAAPRSLLLLVVLVDEGAQRQRRRDVLRARELG